MKYPGVRGGITTYSKNNAELPPQIATLCIFLTMSVAKNGGKGCYSRLREPASDEIQDYSLPPATTLKGGIYLLPSPLVYL